MNPILENDIELSRQIDWWLDDPEIPQDEKDELMKEKVNSMLEVQKQMDKLAMFIDSETKRIEQLIEKKRTFEAAIKKSENKIKWIKGYVLEYMKIKELDTLWGDMYRYKLAKNPPHLVVADESKVPTPFLKNKIEVDKYLLKKYIEDNGETEYAKLESDFRVDIT